MDNTEPTIYDRLWTADEYLALPDDGMRHELLGGVLVMSPRPVKQHQGILSRFIRMLDAPENYMVLTEPNLRLAEDTVMSPDLLVVHIESMDEGSSFNPEDAVLAVEVVSRSSRLTDRVVKPSLNAEAGIPHYWRVEPSQGWAVYVHELDGDERSYLEVGAAHPGKPLTRREPFAYTIDVDHLIRGWPTKRK